MTYSNHYSEEIPVYQEGYPNYPFPTPEELTEAADSFYSQEISQPLPLPESFTCPECGATGICSHCPF